MNDLDSLVNAARAAFAVAREPAALENEKARFLGKSGSVTESLKELARLAPEDRKTRGAAINAAKQAIEGLLEARRGELAEAELNARLAQESIDVTLPGRRTGGGGIHPVLQTWIRVEQIFGSIGFDVADGPEIETYRVDSDATHSPMFHQVEGLWIDEDISFADLKGVYTDFLRCFFETDGLEVRFRPSFFPFTEPSAEIDMMFTAGPNKGKWLEISGAGQVHPTVVRNFGLDPERYIGFAFGSGLERLTMIRHGVDDLRLFFEGDLRFLQQFN